MIRIIKFRAARNNRVRMNGDIIYGRSVRTFCPPSNFQTQPSFLLFLHHPVPPIAILLEHPTINEILIVIWRARVFDSYRKFFFRVKLVRKDFYLFVKFLSWFLVSFYLLSVITCIYNKKKWYNLENKFCKFVNL